MSDAMQYNLPDVGEGLTEAEIVTWRVKVGDTVKVNDIIVEIETAKSLVELPSPYAGTVLDLLVSEGETVPVGTPIISIGAEGAQPSAAPSGEASGASEAPAAEPADEGGDEPAAATLVGYGPRDSAAKRRPRRRDAAVPAGPGGRAAQSEVQSAFQADHAAHEKPLAPATESLPEAVPAARSDAPSGSPAEGVPQPSPGAAVRALAKPPVRKLAKDLGVDLAQVPATGQGGIVTRADVEAFAEDASAAAAAPGTAAPAAAAPAAIGDRETRVPVKGVRKMTAQAMVDSAFTAPHVTEWVTVDASRTMRLVEQLKERREFRDVKVSPLLVVAKAVCLAMRRTPEVNGAWDEQAQEIVLKHYVNLGIAAATPRGLMVPNVKGADSLSLHDLAAALNELTQTAREGKSQPAEMSGGTFTITNVGVFGVDAGTPIINPGESAILCMGAIKQQPWVHKGKVKPRWVTTLALSFDHRMVDGEQGSRFLADVAGIIEEPGTALLH